MPLHTLIPMPFPLSLLHQGEFCGIFLVPSVSPKDSCSHLRGTAEILTANRYTTVCEPASPLKFWWAVLGSQLSHT